MRFIQDGGSNIYTNGITFERFDGSNFKDASDYIDLEFILFVQNSLVLSIKIVFVKSKNSIYSQKYMRYGKNVEQRNSLLQRDLQLWFRTFFHRSYMFCLLMKHIIKNKLLSKQNFSLNTKTYWEKFSKLYVKDIEYRDQSAMSETRTQIFICDANGDLMEMK